MSSLVIPSLPSLSSEDNLTRYLKEIRKFPLLTEEEEYMLARRWQNHSDMEAAHKLVTRHLRLVAKIAAGYRGYGLPLSELIAEGNVGMMQAVKRFDPDRGFRLVTYAIWWIRAAIQEYILHSWSLVKIGTTSAQKKLFFNLRNLKNQMKAIDDGTLTPENVQSIAKTLKVPEVDVVMMNTRLTRQDYSLNVPINNDREGEWQDWLVDETETQEIKIAEQQEHQYRKQLLNQAIQTLNEREYYIFEHRFLSEEPMTLERLSRQLGISRERVRQIEMKAFDKIRKGIHNIMQQTTNTMYPYSKTQ